MILIAVALFAALSYAVTQSGRGGSGISKERAEILAAQILQEVGRFQTSITRLKIIGRYDQVLFNDSAANDSGTCYNGANAITPCHTIGLFNASEGIAPPLWTAEMLDPAQSAQTVVWEQQHRQMQIASTDAGTSAPDIFFLLAYIDPSVCEALNRKLTGDSTAATRTAMTGAGDGYAAFQYNKDGSYSSVLNGTMAIDFTKKGCYTVGGTYHFVYLLEAN